MAKEYEAPELKEAVTETVTGVRFKDIEGLGIIKMRFPTTQERQLSDMEYSRVFTRLLSDGELKTRDEMEKILAQRGIWSSENDKEIDKLQEAVSDSLEKVVRSKNDEEHKKAWEEVQEHRLKIQSIVTKRELYMANTIEAKAEEIRISYLISKTISDENDNLVWKSYEDINNDNRTEIINTIIGEYIFFLNGVESNFLEQLAQGGGEQVESGEQDGE